MQLYMQGESTDSADSAPSEQKHQKRPSSALSRGRGRRGGEKSMSSESDNPLKHQLSTYIRRVAELETRVEELTVKSEVHTYICTYFILKTYYSVASEQHK